MEIQVINTDKSQDDQWKCNTVKCNI